MAGPAFVRISHTKKTTVSKRKRNAKPLAIGNRAYADQISMAQGSASRKRPIRREPGLIFWCPEPPQLTRSGRRMFVRFGCARGAGSLQQIGRDGHSEC